MLLSVTRMSEVPIGIRQRLRDEYTIGPRVDGLWSLTFHDGSTWAIVAYDGEVHQDKILGWAALTQQIDIRPMIGAFVPESYRGQGLASLLVTTLLRYLLGERVLSPGDEIVATVSRWRKYYELCESVGLVCLEWE